MVAPIDLLEGQRYVKQVNNEAQDGYLDHIYIITSVMENYVSPIADGKMNWRSISSYSMYLGEVLENWENQLHKVSMRKCARITKSMQWVGTEVCDLPIYEGFPILEPLLQSLKRK